MGLELLASAGVSIVVQVIKQFTGTRGWVSDALLLAVSVLGASLFVLYRDADFFPTLIQVGLAAAGIYAVFIRKWEQV